MKPAIDRTNLPDADPEQVRREVEKALFAYNYSTYKRLAEKQNEKLKKFRRDMERSAGANADFPSAAQINTETLKSEEAHLETLVNYERESRKKLEKAVLDSAAVDMPSVAKVLDFRLTKVQTKFSTDIVGMKNEMSRMAAESKAEFAKLAAENKAEIIRMAEESKAETARLIAEIKAESARVATENASVAAEHKAESSRMAAEIEKLQQQVTELTAKLVEANERNRLLNTDGDRLSLLEQTVVELKTSSLKNLVGLEVTTTTVGGWYEHLKARAKEMDAKVAALEAAVPLVGGEGRAGKSQPGAVQIGALQAGALQGPKSSGQQLLDQQESASGEALRRTETIENEVSRLSGSVIQMKQELAELRGEAASASLRKAFDEARAELMRANQDARKDMETTYLGLSFQVNTLDARMNELSTADLWKLMLSHVEKEYPPLSGLMLKVQNLTARVRTLEAQIQQIPAFGPGQQAPMMQFPTRSQLLLQPPPQPSAPQQQQQQQQKHQQQILHQHQHQQYPQQNAPVQGWQGQVPTQQQRQFLQQQRQMMVQQSQVQSPHLPLSPSLPSPSTQLQPPPPPLPTPPPPPPQQQQQQDASQANGMTKKRRVDTLSS